MVGAEKQNTIRIVGARLCELYVWQRLLPKRKKNARGQRCPNGNPLNQKELEIWRMLVVQLHHSGGAFEGQSPSGRGKVSHGDLETEKI
jgi:hypothetical protein